MSKMNKTGFLRDFTTNLLQKNVGVGSGEWGMGNGEWGIATRYSPFPTPHSPLPFCVNSINTPPVDDGWTNATSAPPAPMAGCSLINLTPRAFNSLSFA